MDWTIEIRKRGFTPCYCSILDTDGISDHLERDHIRPQCKVKSRYCNVKAKKVK